MPERFVPMREWLRPPAPVEDVCIQPPEEPEAHCDPDPLVDEVIREARRFRAALADTVAFCARDLLTEIASDVLARELQLQPCDLSRIVESALERYGVMPLRIRAHPSDAAALEETWSVVRDEELRRGDAVIETAAGSIDARLGVRLARVLSAVDP